jgi:hypothetical protein
MRKFLLVVWLMIPVAAWAYHKGPGQRQLVLDDAARLLTEADRLAAAEDWAAAEAKYEAALVVLPGDKLEEAQRVRLERAKVQMMAKKLPTAHADLKALVDEMQSDSAANPRLLAEARQSLANAQYYMTWLMRLEGKSREEWEPEIDAARQTFRLLAEQGESSGDKDAAQRHREDLESAVRLARMDLADLQGLPLPSQ